MGALLALAGIIIAWASNILGIGYFLFMWANGNELPQSLLYGFILWLKALSAGIIVIVSGVTIEMLTDNR